MTPADSFGTVGGPDDIVHSGPSPSQWDADEPFFRYAKHYLNVAYAANSFFASPGCQYFGKVLAKLAHDYENRRRCLP